MAEKTKLLKENIVADIESAVNKTLAGFSGIELVELGFSQEYGRLNVTVYLWKKSGIDLNDCEAVHNLLSAELDSIELELPDAYVLNVSSSGLDRKIVSDDDFRRALDTEIEAIVSNKDKFHGILKEYNEKSFSYRCLWYARTRFVSDIRR